MTSLFRYFKLLFSDDERLMEKWNQLSNEKVTEKYKGAVAKELKKRDYHYDGIKWIKSSPSNIRGNSNYLALLSWLQSLFAKKSARF